MRISSPSGDFLELKVAGYQFPDLPDAQYDSNWLLIEGAASIGGRSWTFRDPSLLTYELAALAAWLRDLAEDKEVQPEMSFIEPNLSFRKEGGILRAHLALECAPPWRELGDDWEKHRVEASADAAELIAASEALFAMLRLYPQRAER